MKGLMRLVLPLALLCLIVCTAQAALDYASVPDTVHYAVARPDGVRVSITMVVIGRIDANGVSVHEFWDKTNPIRVLLRPTGLKVGQTIDIEGRMTTLPGGKRAVIADRIALYLDQSGRLAPGVPPIKGVLDPSVWPFRGWIPVTQTSPFSGMSTQAITPLDGPGPPGTVGGSPTVQLTLTPGTIPWAKSLADSTTLGSTPLTGKIVTAATGQLSNCIYIEEPDRRSGIRVQWTGASFSLGDRVQVSGTMNTANGERYIGSATVTLESHGEQLKPTGLVQREIGGGAFMEGQTTYQQGVLGGTGLNNIGLLVRTWGKVTYKDAYCMYIDDGTAPSDGSGHVGVRVEPGSGVVLPPEGTTAEFTGISSCTVLNGHVVRVLRVRMQNDAPVVMHVKPASAGGSDTNNGSMWALAKATVQAAINAATSGMDIWVAAGTYNERITLAAGRRLYGGFAGNEIRRDGRNILGNPTILDGGQLGSVVNGANNAVMDGFTITNGKSNGSGVYCSYVSPTVSNCRITGNKGTGVYCYQSSPSIIDCEITENSDKGVYCYVGGNAIISGCRIADNSAVQYAGILCNSASPTIKRCTVTGNNATGAGVRGGGISFLSCGSTTSVENCLIAENSAPMGAGVYCSMSSPSFMNCTIVNNSAVTTGGNLYLTTSSPTFRNTIVAYGVAPIGGGAYKNTAANPRFTYCDFWQNGTEPFDPVSWNPSSGTGNIVQDPLFVDLLTGDYHLSPASSCVDAGTYESAPAEDIDGNPRPSGARTDIGAYEYYHPDGCIWYRPTLYASPVSVEMGGTSVITVTVIDPVTREPISGRQVTLEVTGGFITEINGNALPPGTTSAAGDTDAGGNVTAKVTRDTAGEITITARVSNSCETGETTESITVWFGMQQYVGFIYDLAYNDPQVREAVDNYLTRISAEYPWVNYQRITGTPFSIDASLNTVFLAMPTRSLYQAELDSLSAFVQSGRKKRIVLIGEYVGDCGISGYSCYNQRLNDIASGLGINSRFSTAGSVYDGGTNRTRLCSVNSTHYLADGVVNLWDAATSTFATGWEAYARPLAYINGAPTLPWILEEDTDTAGSIILIHDSSMMGPDYNNEYDTVPDKNFRFIKNLCARFPQ